ncbi:hypothetical protein [Clostridium botulinum]|uniref:hypothetical protein n=1 Tax=Clostridium botulinum TaxID=1491 RepID=UPI0004D7F9A0|nr:hypothetical protein [Clostridium botulinum]KEI01228.1 hypothetical protein Z953_08945 [Clostridium botulinum D str. 16868]NFF60745.1 S1 family peptidase [Clostridium botulinum]NFL04159.1 S1 family peptidase [Clostridium botulinum]
MNINCNLDQQILYIARCQYKFFLSKPNVVGVGLGIKLKNGIDTGQNCIKVFVTRKLPQNNLCKNALVPTLYQGIITDVEEIQNNNLYYPKNNFSSMNNPFTKRVRPTPGGYAIGPASNVLFGSLGCIVKDDMGKHYLFSSAHVLTADYTVPLGTEIIQPSYPFHGHAPNDTIGTLYKYIPLNFTGANFADAGIALVSDLSKVSNKVALIGDIKGVSLPVLRLSVKKTGYKTGLTKGTIKSIGVTRLYSYEHGAVLFKNLILTSNMSNPGDSGSILFDNSNKAIGILFGGDAQNSIFNPISIALDLLHVQLIIH